MTAADCSLLISRTPGRVCSGCGQRAWPKRAAARNVLTAAGVVHLTRLYHVCPRCRVSRHALDDRLGVNGFVSPHAQRLLCLAGASWSFDRAAANLQECCGLAVCDNTIRAVCHAHGGATGYAARLAEGQSIGSGLVEGSCKQVVGKRLKQTGARWKVRRVERLATLCAVQASDQWEVYGANAA